ncbi:mitochondrial import inner membrane translocase subunit tim54 [Quaeritorhiza haematococci]|nr:mitochondrial import inner membrane translocase subunit tim54 [Quaeritorhiza haematococci]
MASPSAAASTAKKGFFNFKLPSRNWLIFWGVTGTLTSLAVYDKQELKKVRSKYCERVSHLALEPMKTDETPRKVVVFLAPSQYARYTFKEYVKPVFDAAALDYEFIEPRTAGEVQKRIRELVWTGKEEAAAKMPTPAPEISTTSSTNSSWRSRLFGGSRTQNATSSFASQQIQPPMDPIQAFMQRPKYNPEEGLIAVGPEAWGELLTGISEGFLSLRPSQQQESSTPTNTDSDSSDSSSNESTTPVEPTFDLSESNLPQAPYFQPPTIGFIPGQNLVGWTRFPHRIYRWFIERKVMEEVGEHAVKVVLGNRRELLREDLRQGGGLVGNKVEGVEGEGEGREKKMKESVRAWLQFYA